MTNTPPYRIVFGFHAVSIHLKTAPKAVAEIFFDASRRDARMRQFIERAKEAQVQLIEADGLRLSRLAGNHGHQGVVARVAAVKPNHSLDDLLDSLQEPPLLLVLDGIQDPHNLGDPLGDGPGTVRACPGHTAWSADGDPGGRAVERDPEPVEQCGEAFDTGGDGLGGATARSPWHHSGDHGAVGLQQHANGLLVVSGPTVG